MLAVISHPSPPNRPTSLFCRAVTAERLSRATRKNRQQRSGVFSGDRRFRRVECGSFSWCPERGTVGEPLGESHAAAFRDDRGSSSRGVSLRRVLHEAGVVSTHRTKRAAFRSLAEDARERMQLLSPSDAQVYFWRASFRAWELVGVECDVELVEETSRPDAVFQVNVKHAHG